MTQDNSWQDKVAIITGGSSGIGKAVAMELVEKGAKVLITGRSAEKLEEVASSSEAIETLQVDSADADSGTRIVEAAIGRWGRLDLVVNNAGAGQPLPIKAYNAEVIANMSAVNIVAPSQLVMAGHAALRKNKGAIVNIGTAVSQNAAPVLAHYAAPKLHWNI